MLYVADQSNAVVLRGMLLPGAGGHGIAVTASPQPLVVSIGGSAALTVSANGPSLAYQWHKDGAPIPNGTVSTLYLPRTVAGDEGVYAVTVSNAVGSVEAAPATVTLVATRETSRLVNLSVRARAGAGAQMLTVGAVVGGAASAEEAVILVRAVGPALRRFGVESALADPALTLFRGTDPVATNDNWGASPALAQTFADVGAFALESASLDAALVRSLSPAAYSIQIAGRDARTGVALAEIYDTTGSAAQGAKLVNLSTRAEVGSNDDILIAGFTVGGRTSKTLLIRGIGPTLREFGVAGTLANPQLRVLAGDRLVAANDNWGETAVLRSAFTNVGAFPLSSQFEAALLLTLAPGSYSAQVSGVRGDTGVGLVEIYELP